MSDRVPGYVEVYRGSERHKHRTTRGAKGTRCPEWTHIVDDVSVGVDMFDHAWLLTRAQQLLDTSVVDLHTHRRYTCGDGMAFEIKHTIGNVFHGYPVAWDRVPRWLQGQWKREGRVNQRQINRWSEVSGDLWALESDDAR